MDQRGGTLSSGYPTRSQAFRQFIIRAPIAAPVTINPVEQWAVASISVLRVAHTAPVHSCVALDLLLGHSYTFPVRTAFKEWAIVVDALGRGEQILVLRKGGIAEGPGGFRVEHPRFLFFPTLYHQQRESVLPVAQTRYDVIAPHWPGPEVLRLEFCGEVVAWRKLDSLVAVERLRGQHIWRDDVLAERFDWGKQQNLFALAVRVRRLPQRFDLAMLPAYGGCKSWIELAEDIDAHDAEPVLAEADFQAKLKLFASTLSAS